MYCVVYAFFSVKRAELGLMGRSGDELKDKCLFIRCRSDDHVAHVAAHGVEVKALSLSSLGKFIFLYHCCYSNVVCYFIFCLFGISSSFSVISVFTARCMQHMLARYC